MIRNLNPDVITLDVEMPRMDGIDFLAPDAPAADAGGDGLDADRARRRGHAAALELGAVDFVAKPKIGVADGLRQLGEDITDKIRTAAKARRKPPAPRARARRRAAPAARAAHRPGAGLARSAGCRPRRSSSSAPPPAAPRPRARCWCNCRPTARR
jgi:two-component system, chemotaxis family, protein-glutamate methylesterase/glutaminase